MFPVLKSLQEMSSSFVALHTSLTAAQSCFTFAIHPNPNDAGFLLCLHSSIMILCLRIKVVLGSKVGLANKEYTKDADTNNVSSFHCPVGRAYSSGANCGSL